MFVSPFTVSLGCDIAVIVVYLQRPNTYGGTVWFTMLPGVHYSEEMVDIVWLAILRIAFILPHFFPFLKRQRLTCPELNNIFVAANFILVAAKAVALLVTSIPQEQAFWLWWVLLLLSGASVLAQRACLYHLRSSHATPRYKTIFIGSRLDARLLNNRDFRSEFDGTEFDERDLETGEMDDSDVDDDPTDEGGGMSIGRGGDGDSSTAKRTKGGGRGESMRRVPSRSRQQSTQELVDFFAGRMQEARGAWTARVEALQKRWRASILRGDWGRRNARLSDRDEALKMTFGLMVRLYAYEDALNDLRRAAEEEPSCLEFFAPQLASFLVFDSYYMSGQMEEWLLARCSENLYFAHALEFSLRANCLLPAAEFPSSGISTSVSPAQAAVTPKGGKALDIQRQGSDGSAALGGGGGDAGDDVDGAIDRFGRRAVELLLVEIAESGEKAAQRLLDAGRSFSPEAGIGSGGVEGDAPRDDAGDGGAPPPGVVLAARVPADESKGDIGVAAEATTPASASSPMTVATPYWKNLHFLASLVEIAASLKPLSKTDRTLSLHKQLENVDREYLSVQPAVPDAAVAPGRSSGGGSSGGGHGGGTPGIVYVPVGDRRHRVVAIHSAESFAFSTRERVPCFVCLEVIGSSEPPIFDDGEYPGMGGEREGVGRGMWQWLPASLRSPKGMRFRRTFRFPGGREWRLSLGEDGDEESEVHGGGGDLEESGRDSSEEAGETTSRDGHYRLLSDEGPGVTDDGGSASGSRRRSIPLSDSREWWAEDNHSGGSSTSPDRGEGRNIREGGRGTRRSRTADPMSPSSDNNLSERWLPPSPETRDGGEESAGFGSVEDKDIDRRSASRRGSSSIVTGGGEVPDGAAAGRICSVCGARVGEKCREGCPSERSRRPELLLTAGGSDVKQEGERGGGEEGRPQPQVLFNELWKEKSDRIRRTSRWANRRGWRLLPVIVKANDDLRQEQLASQLLFTMWRILRVEGVRVWLRPYDITALSADSGIIEAIPDTISLDALRRYRRRPTRSGGAGAEGGDVAGGGGSGGGTGESGASSGFSLTGFFEARFGPRESTGFKQAQRRFIESLAAYSIACYLLQIKDRHNGNILLDAQGRLIHVDFGFMLANSPGGNLGFESAPFKLTPGFIDLMGGTRSRCFRDFRGLCVDAYLALRRNSQEIVLLVEMMASGNEQLPCFQGPGGGAAAAADLAARFQPDLNDPACVDFVHKLVQQSAGSWTTAWYDKYQRFFSGIY